MKMAVIGGRDFDNYEYMCEVLDEYDITTVVSGGARGADSLAERYAQERGIPTIIFPADWDKHGRSAGYIRNKDIVDTCDGCVTFWDGISKGTNHSINLADKVGKLLCIAYYQGNV